MPGGGEGGISQTGKREYTRRKNGREKMISAEEKNRARRADRGMDS